MHGPTWILCANLTPFSLKATLQELQSLHFVDKFTRALSVQLVVYNQNDFNPENEGPQTSLFGAYRADRRESCRAVRLYQLIITRRLYS
jgi:hypothetical protein